MDIMKKRLTKLLVLLGLFLVSVTMGGCGLTEEVATPSEETSFITATTKEKREFFECETLEQYQEEVHRRMKNSEDFFTEEEIYFYQEVGLSVEDSKARVSGYKEDYYYPIVVSQGYQIELWYTDEYGDVESSEFRVYGDNSYELGFGEHISPAHHEYVEGEIFLEENPDYSVVYNEASGEISKWFFGELLETCEVPKNAIEAGLSIEGNLFRSGTDVYAVKYKESFEVELIAHNVQQVLLADYPYISDFFAQPLLLMTDNTVKVYIGWTGEKEVPADSLEHLHDVKYEGGYH